MGDNNVVKFPAGGNGFRKSQVPTKKELAKKAVSDIGSFALQLRAFDRVLLTLINKSKEIEEKLDSALFQFDLMSMTFKGAMKKYCGVKDEDWEKLLAENSKILEQMYEDDFDKKHNFKTVDRALKTGDFVVFSISKVDETTQEKELINGWLCVQVGNHEVIEEIDKSFIDKKTGDDYIVDATYPANYPDTTLAGKKVICAIKILGVKEKLPPQSGDQQHEPNKNS